MVKARLHVVPRRIQLVVGVLLVCILLGLAIWQVTLLYFSAKEPQLVSYIVTLAALAVIGLFACYALFAAQTREALLATDQKTGVLSETEFNRFLEEELKRASRFCQSFSILFVDVNDFRNLNKRFGHAIGDLVLRDIAGILSDATRPNLDRVGRRGSASDEFMILLPMTDRKGGEIVAGKLKEAVAIHQLPDLSIELSISVGISDFPAVDTKKRLARMLQEADEQMLKDKEQLKVSRRASARDKKARAPENEQAESDTTVLRRVKP